MALVYKIEPTTESKAVLINGIPYTRGTLDIIAAPGDPTVQFGIILRGSGRVIVPKTATIDEYRDDGDNSFVDFNAFVVYINDFFFRDVAGGTPLIPSMNDVDEFGDLPTPAIDYDGEYWIVNVTTKTGTWPTRTTLSKGIYKSVSGAWDFKGADVPAYLVDDTLLFTDDSSGNGLGFVLDNLTANRQATWQDKSGTVAYVGDLTTITDVTTATYTILSTDTTLNVTRTMTGTCVITWPTALINSGRGLTIKDAGLNSGTFNITLETQGGQTIDGDANWTIDGNGDWLILYSDGSNLFITG